MSASDELAQVIRSAEEYGPDHDYILPAKAADAVLAAGYSKPRTITTVAELDALPFYSIVTRNSVPYTKTVRGWQLAGATHIYSAESLLLNDNATVIHEPAA